MAAANNNNVERCFGVTNIKHHIPVVLDLDQHNYDAWRELLLTHCMAFDVAGHLDGTLLPANDADDAWRKRDGLVKLWLYGTMTPPLFKSTFKTGGSARDLWLRVENEFRNNKEARAIELDNQLRTLQIGDLSVRDYSQKMKETADLLSNVDAPVSERTLVMYLINGLNEKFDNIINVIKHKEPFPNFASAKSMLEWEETRINKSTRATAAHKDTASSSTALTATTQSQAPADQSSQPRYNNNTRGRGRFNNRGRGGRGNNYNNNRNWNSQPRWPSAPPFPYWPQYPIWPPSISPQFAAPSAPPQPPQANLIEFPPMMLPQAYTSETLPDASSSSWYMDSGASAHLAATPGSSKSEAANPM